MKRGPLTHDELRHLEHRWGVLGSFLDVSSDPAHSGAAGNTKEGRIFRGCMDGAIATCRALCERFELTMNSSSWTTKHTTLQPCTPEFKKKVGLLSTGSNDSEREALWEVLVAANRCVCHLEDKLIDHNVTTETLKDAIGVVRAIIRAKLIDAHLPLALCT